ncbi:uncharacterized protein KY384_008647 [Bacidia gigantensis]|uniref:uncharacterized protein n=1 Tax=Bacidia gigantensis TaxID=2732470 RepID=UPI001D0461B2|nr:uncharacterized protein KY384_008647 [Bacidia gigantensis]KAG8527217.1 hypothetical protein KY384_008647 [Bacidia gigantensis]
MPDTDLQWDHPPPANPSGPLIIFWRLYDARVYNPPSRIRPHVGQGQFSLPTSRLSDISIEQIVFEITTAFESHEINPLVESEANLKDRSIDTPHAIDILS